MRVGADNSLVTEAVPPIVPTGRSCPWWPAAPKQAGLLLFWAPLPAWALLCLPGDFRPILPPKEDLASGILC